MAVSVWERQLMCSLDSFPGSDVPGECVLLVASFSCVGPTVGQVKTGFMMALCRMSGKLG